MYSASRRSAIFDALASEYLHVNTITKLLPSKEDAMEGARNHWRRETQDKAERVSVITGREMKWEEERRGREGEHEESEEERNAAEGFEGNESHHYE